MCACVFNCRPDVCVATQLCVRGGEGTEPFRSFQGNPSPDPHQPVPACVLDPHNRGGQTADSGAFVLTLHSFYQECEIYGKQISGFVWPLYIAVLYLAFLFMASLRSIIYTFHHTESFYQLALLPFGIRHSTYIRFKTFHLHSTPLLFFKTNDTHHDSLQYGKKDFTGDAYVFKLIF